jgi:hypothetical protein
VAVPQIRASVRAKVQGPSFALSATVEMNRMARTKMMAFERPFMNLDKALE